MIMNIIMNSSAKHAPTTMVVVLGVEYHIRQSILNPQDSKPKLQPSFGLWLFVH